MNRWLPTLTWVWALAAMVVVMQPCREAFAAGLPHSHGVQVASDAHPHRHTEATGGNSPADEAACHCTELSLPLKATTLDLQSPSSAPSTLPLPVIVGPASAAPEGDLATTTPEHPSGTATYLATRRLRI